MADVIPVFPLSHVLLLEQSSLSHRQRNDPRVLSHAVKESGLTILRVTLATVLTAMAAMVSDHVRANLGSGRPVES